MVKNSSVKFYFAIGIISIFTILIFFMLKSYINAILTSIVLTFLVYPIYVALLNKIKNKSLSAALILFGVLFLILVPLTIFSGVFLNYVNNMDLSEQKIEQYENSINSITGIEISIADTILTIENKLKSEARSTLPKILSFTSNFLLSSFIIFFIMFYLLVQKEIFMKYFIMLLPFSTKGSKHLIDEGGKIIRAVLIGQVLTAVVQGTLGMISFFIAGVSGAFFWGIVMIILSIIPVVGAFLIWLPVGIFLILEGNYFMGGFVLIWGAVVVSQIDNFIRPKLVEKFAKIHPLETFIGVLAGIGTFGFIGIILGPLFLSLFKTFLKIFIKEYID
ncbi:MAG: AI-2E family transporter [Nanoarchaeota archaeon]